MTSAHNDSVTDTEKFRVTVSNVSIEIPGPPRLEGRCVPTPKQLIDEKLVQLMEMIAHLLAKDPLCNEGRGHIIKDSPVQESRIIRAVQEQLESTTPWTLQYVPGSEFSLKLVLGPVYLQDWLRQSIIKQAQGWNFEHGTLVIPVDGLDEEIVKQVYNSWTKQGWLCETHVGAGGNRVLCIKMRLEDFAHVASPPKISVA